MENTPNKKNLANTLRMLAGQVSKISLGINDGMSLNQINSSLLAIAYDLDPAAPDFENIVNN